MPITLLGLSSYVSYRSCVVRIHVLIVFVVWSLCCFFFFLLLFFSGGGGGGWGVGGTAGLRSLVGFCLLTFA